MNEQNTRRTFNCWKNVRVKIHSWHSSRKAVVYLFKRNLFLVPDKWQISGSDSVVEEVTAAARMANAPSNLSPEEAQIRKVALDMRALLCVNSSKGVFPNRPTDEPSDPDFPDVDCDQVYQNIYLGDR